MTIQFSCPLCGKQTVVAAQFQGQTRPCPACGGTITVPGPVLFEFLALAFGAALFCGIWLTMFWGGVQNKRDRTQAANNLKMLGRALHNYHDLHGTLPPAVVTDADGHPLYSGRVLLLPFLEQAGLYNAFDKSKAWDSPENLARSQTPVAQFQYRSHRNGSATRADFVFVTGNGTLFDGHTAARFADVHDGLSQTIAMVETTTGPDHWAAPVEWNADTGVFPVGHEPKRGLLVLVADGTIRTLEYAYYTKYLRLLVDIKDGQPLSPEL